MSFSEPCSMPLAHRTMGVPAVMTGAKARRLARRCWAGVTFR